MAKTHFKLSPDPLPEGESYFMECGARVQNSRFNFRMEPGHSWPEGASTLQFCDKCVHHGLGNPSFQSFYIYGVIEGEESKHGEYLEAS